jgi:hypothetical protein
VEEEVEKKELVILDVAAPLISVPVICLHRKQNRLPGMAKTFVDYLKTKKVFGRVPTEPIPAV